MMGSGGSGNDNDGNDDGGGGSINDSDSNDDGRGRSGNDNDGNDDGGGCSGGDDDDFRARWARVTSQGSGSASSASWPSAAAT